MMRRKDPTEWRKKVDAWRNGTPTSELFNLPKYGGGTDDDYETSPTNRLLAGIMRYARRSQGGLSNPFTVDWYPQMSKENAAQDTYLMSKEDQEKVFLSNGYLKGKDNDYGLVKKAVGNRNLPVYQTAEDSISRDTLVPIANVPADDTINWYGPEDARLYHAGHYPTTIYVDGKTGKYYQKAWDLNDYGSSTAGKRGRTYEHNNMQKFAELLDDIGNPVVVTTGFQEITPDNLKYSEDLKDIIDAGLKKKGYSFTGSEISKFLDPTNINNYTLPEVEVTAPKKHDNGKSIKPLTKYDDGTGDKIYLPEYEYEATVTPQGTSLEKHKRITNEEDWQKYWSNVGAGYVNQAQESVAVPTLKALKELTYFTPIGAATSLGDAIAAHMNGGSPEEILSATVGALPEVRFANNVGRFARYANVADDMIQINPELLQRLQEGDFVTKRRFGSATLGKIEDVLRNYKTSLRQGYANAKRQLLGTAVKNRKILPKQVQKIVDDQIDNQHLKEYWSGPFAFNQPEYRWGDMTSLSYFNMTPKQVMGQAMQDMNDIPVGSRFLVNSLSTDSYPLVIHMLDSKISPNFKLNPVTDRIVLNGMGNLHGQAAVDRINKKLQQLEIQRGMSLGRAKRYVSPIGEEQITAPFLTAERLYDKGKSIHINPANKGKFNATKKRTGKTTEQLAHSKNPLTRKRAIFALNSRKWKH